MFSKIATNYSKVFDVVLFSSPHENTDGFATDCVHTGDDQIQFYIIIYNYFSHYRTSSPVNLHSVSRASAVNTKSSP